MPSELEDIERVLFAIHIARTPAKIRDVLLDRNALHTQIGNVDSDTAARIRDEAAELATSVGVISADNSRFPVQLVRRGKPLFLHCSIGGNSDFWTRQWSPSAVPAR